MATTTKTLKASIDAVLIITLLVFSSFGGNFFQRFQYSDLLDEHNDLHRSTLEAEKDLVMVANLLRTCRDGANYWAATDPAPDAEDEGEPN